MKYFLMSWFLLLIISDLPAQENRSSVSIELSPDYPTNFLQYTHWGDYELKPDFEKMHFTDQVVEGFPDAQKKHCLMLSYYTSAEMVEQKFQIIFVLPGDQISIKISKNEAGYFEINFRGNNAEGHVQMAKFRERLPAEYIREMKRISREQSDYSNAVIEYIESHTRPFQELLERELIDSAYYYVVTDYIQSIFVRSIVSGFFRARENIGSGIELDRKYKIADRLIEYFDYANPNNSALKSVEFAFNRIDLLRYEYLKENGFSDYSEIQEYQLLWKEKNYYIASKYVPIFEESEELLRKYLMAATLHFEYRSLLGPQFEGSRGELYALFKAYYPRSRYLSDLEESRMRNSERYFELFGSTKEKKVDDDYRFFQKWDPEIIDNKGEQTSFDFQKEISNLDTSYVINLSEGIYYVNIWATWCAPCLKEFSNNYSADSLLHTFGAHRIYISIDDQNRYKIAWNQSIKDYRLGGYHILAGEELRQHLFEEYGPGNTILIPQYLLMKDGVVINEFAPKPSELGELREILELVVDE